MSTEEIFNNCKYYYPVARNCIRNFARSFGRLAIWSNSLHFTNRVIEKFLANQANSRLSVPYIFFKREQAITRVHRLDIAIKRFLPDRISIETKYVCGWIVKEESLKGDWIFCIFFFFARCFRAPVRAKVTRRVQNRVYMASGGTPHPPSTCKIYRTQPFLPPEAKSNAKR